MADKSMLTLDKASRRFNIPKSTFHSAIHGGRLTCVKDDGVIYVAQDDVERFAKNYVPRPKTKGRGSQQRKTTNHKPKSNTSVFISLLMKIVGELSKIENGLSGQAQTTVQQLKNEIMRTIQGIEL